MGYIKNVLNFQMHHDIIYVYIICHRWKMVKQHKGIQIYNHIDHYINLIFEGCTVEN